MNPDMILDKDSLSYHGLNTDYELLITLTDFTEFKKFYFKNLRIRLLYYLILNNNDIWKVLIPFKLS